LADYQKHGRQALDRMRKEDPTAYIRMIASLVPKQIDKAPNPLEHFTNEELDQLEAHLQSIANKGAAEADEYSCNSHPIEGSRGAGSHLEVVHGLDHEREGCGPVLCRPPACNCGGLR
jgi:hypothetical protein